VRNVISTEHVNQVRLSSYIRQCSCFLGISKRRHTRNRFAAFVNQLNLSHCRRKMFSLLVLLLLLCGCVASMPLPFTQQLQMGDRDKLVRLVRILLARTPGVATLNATDDLFDASVANAMQTFQSQHQLTPTAALDDATASALLLHNEPDGWRDPLAFPLPSQYLYKVWIPVHRNRTVQAQNATLFDQRGNVLLTFVARLHGKNHPDGSQLNQFTSNGVTPTGLFEFDLNSPEPDPVSYGPYPVNRATRGLRGNAVVVISDNKTTTLRSGILMHTASGPTGRRRRQCPTRTAAFTPGQSRSNTFGTRSSSSAFRCARIRSDSCPTPLPRKVCCQLNKWIEHQHFIYLQLEVFRCVCPRGSRRLALAR
jgi:hypothetical protein